MLTVVDDMLTVRLTRDMWQLESEHVDMARAVSAVAAEHGAIPVPSAVQEVQLAIAAKPDKIDVEVVTKLDSMPDHAFGFQLRSDENGPARRAMLDLLRDALDEGYRVTLDIDILDQRRNGIIMRTAVTKG